MPFDVTSRTVSIRFKGDVSASDMLLVVVEPNIPHFLVPAREGWKYVLRLHSTYINEEVRAAAEATAKRINQVREGGESAAAILEKILKSTVLTLKDGQHTFQLGGFDHLSLSTVIDDRSWHVWDSEKIVEVQPTTAQEARRMLKMH
jgi:hypothetical protein